MTDQAIPRASAWPYSGRDNPSEYPQSRPAHRQPQVVGGVEQHDEFTPVDLLWLTPRRTRTLLRLLDGPQTIDREALMYFARVGIVGRNERGEYLLTDPRGREVAEKIRRCHPPCLRGKG